MDAPPPRPKSLEDLNFTPLRRMTPWLSPRQLLDTAMRVLLSATFGAYSDKREIEATIAHAPPEPYPGSEMWIDYVADLGDAFAPTYAIAALLAKPELALVSGEEPTKRGGILVMGGDQVYPTASIAAYQDQTIGPYRAALPYVDPKVAPHLFVVPGNHDWYDGLTAFMRTFCQRHWIGGWCTRQTRSYFAAQLPHRWWLWGIDIQFESYLDTPQLDYFAEIIGPQMRPGDSVILCSPTPSWVAANEDPDEKEGVGAYRTIDYLERKVIRPHGAEVRLAITGDAHHYARYAQTVDGDPIDGGAQKITAGGGGAFLSATHHLPQRLVLPPRASRDPGKSDPPTHWKLEERYPSKEESTNLRHQVLKLPRKNPEMAAFIGVVTLLVAWMAQAQVVGGLASRPSFHLFVWRLAHNPLALLLGAGLVFGIVAFTDTTDKKKKWTLGLAHAVAQLLAMLSIIWVAARLCSFIDSYVNITGFVFALLFTVVAGGLGALVGAEVLAVYLWIADTDRFRLNANELFAAQNNPDWKNFVRLHLGADRVLTVYPVGVDKTPRQFRVESDGARTDPWLTLSDPSLECHLIEKPVRIEPTRPSVSAPAGPRRTKATKAAPDTAARRGRPRKETS